MSTKNISTSVADRHNYIVAQSLIYAIAQIQSLPADRQDFSNMCDMCTIARTLPLAMLVGLVFNVQNKTETTVDFWPGNDADFDFPTFNERKAFKFGLNAGLLALSEFLDDFARNNPLTVVPKNLSTIIAAARP